MSVTSWSTFSPHTRGGEPKFGEQFSEVAVFGSVLRGDFCPDSDVDVLVKLAPGAQHTLFDLVRMQEELREIFGRDVDLVEKTAIERSRNSLRWKVILETAEIVYAGG